MAENFIFPHTLELTLSSHQAQALACWLADRADCAPPKNIDQERFRQLRCCETDFVSCAELAEICDVLGPGAVDVIRYSTPCISDPDMILGVWGASQKALHDALSSLLLRIDGIGR